MRRSWLPLLLLLLAVPALAAEDPAAKKAREELERELRALTEIAPPRLEILYDPPPGLPFKLVEAQLVLDDVPLVLPAIDALNGDGPHRVFAAKVPAGRHVLHTRMVFVRSAAGVFTYLSGFRWKLETRATFDVSPGIEVRVIARPAKAPEAKAEKDELTLRHDLEGTVLAPPEAPPAPVAAPDAGPPAPATPPPPPPATLRVTATAKKKPVAARARVVGAADAVTLSAAPGTAGTAIEAPAGRVSVELLADGYLAQVKVVEAAAGAETALPFELVPAPKKPGVKRVGDRLELTRPLPFDAKKGALGPGGEALVAELVDAILRAEAKKITVEGHTDNRGDKTVLQARSAAHAEAVAAALVAAGLDPARVESAGQGDTQPIAPNLTPAGRKRNNRVELRLHP